MTENLHIYKDLLPIKTLRNDESTAALKISSSRKTLSDLYHVFLAGSLALLITARVVLQKQLQLICHSL
jgi:hypothetical protein